MKKTTIKYANKKYMVNITDQFKSNSRFTDHPQDISYTAMSYFANLIQEHLAFEGFWITKLDGGCSSSLENINNKVRVGYHNRSVADDTLSPLTKFFIIIDDKRTDFDIMMPKLNHAKLRKIINKNTEQFWYVTFTNELKSDGTLDIIYENYKNSFDEIYNFILNL
jgi:hypothetical protein